MSKNTTKNTVNPIHLTVPVTPPAGPVADPLPGVGAPHPPPGFTAPGKLGRGTTILGSQLVIASQVAAELGGSPTYAQDFGPRVPDQTTLANALVFSAGWSAEEKDASDWRVYTKVEEKLAWKHTMGMMAELRPFFLLTTEKDSTVAARYPVTAKFFAAAVAAGKKAAKTKAKKKRTAAKAAAATPQGGTASPKQG
jgi:hypothetical protein